MAHKFDLRIYFEDTDAGGIVYHANYLNFTERARTELLREIGYTSSSLMEEFQTAFVVRHVEAEYHKTAHLDDILQVQSRVLKIGGSSIILQQDIYRDTHLVFSMKMAIVYIDLNVKKPVRIPQNIREGFANYE